MLPSDGSPPAALAPNASTPQASSVLTPLSAASGAAPAAASITAATYTRHYTGSGSNATDSFYVDVTITESYGPTDQSPTPVDQGTVSYTAWMKHFGRYVYNVTNAAVPINAGGPMALGYTSFGEMTAGGVLSDLGLSTGGWDHAHWSETITRTAAGTVAGAGGAVYLFASRFTQSDWRDVVSTAPPIPESPSPSTTVTYGGQSTSDAAVSDLAANLPTGAAAGAGGRPTGLFDAPAAGTTYLVRSFDSEKWDGTDRTTHAFDADGYATGTGLTRAFGYSGADGYRDFENVTTRTGATTDPSYDTLTRQVDYQREGSYGGSQSYNLTGVGMLGTLYNGSETTEQYDSGKVLKNVSDYKDVYHHTSGVVANGSTLVVADGVVEVKLGDGGKASTYSDDLTLAQHFDLTGALNSDVLTYDQRRAGDTTTVMTAAAVSKSYGYTTVAPAPSNDLTVTNTYVRATDRRHDQSDVSGELDLLDHTGSVDFSSSYSGSDKSVVSPTTSYVSADGSYHRDGFSDGVTTGDYSGSAAIQGDVDASGNQIDGTSSSYKQSNSESSGLAWQKESGADTPTKTTDDVSSANSASWARSTLTYNPDGTTNGARTGASDSFSDDETTVTAKGSYHVPGGTAGADDRDHRTTHQSQHAYGDLTLASGAPTGTVHSEVDSRTDYDHYLHHTLDMDDGSLHAVLGSGDSANDAGSSGVGFTSSTDVVDAVFCSGDLSATRVFDFGQQENTGTKLTSRGSLSDDQGHTGSWSAEATSGSTVGKDAANPDRVEVTSTWDGGAWAESARTFHLDDWSGRFARIDEHDDGLGSPTPAAPATAGDRQRHTQQTETRRSAETVRDGAPADYTYKYVLDADEYQKDTRSGAASSPATDDSSEFQSETAAERVLKDERDGAARGGAEQDAYVSHRMSDDERSSSSHTLHAAAQDVETHTQDRDAHITDLEGDPRAGGTGTGTNWWLADHRRWTVTTTHPGESTVQEGNENARPKTHTESLDWPGSPPPAVAYVVALRDALWEDFTTSAEARWFGAHAGDLLRVGGGYFDFVAGFAMALGSGGLAALPGVGLMAVGIDQMYAGEMGIITGQSGPSVIEFGAYQAARGLGADDGAAQVIGSLTPAALSLVFTLGGELVAVPTPLAEGQELFTIGRRGGTIITPDEFQELKDFMASRGVDLAQESGLPPQLRLRASQGAKFLPPRGSRLSLIVLKDDATWYEFLHEFYHSVDWERDPGAMMRNLLESVP